MNALILWVVLAILSLGSADPVTTSDAELSREINYFSQSLYQQIPHSENNLVYSPFSVHAALSMTSLGARGDTQVEMMRSLGTSWIGSPHTAYKSLNDQLHSVQDIRLEVANGLFVNPLIPLYPSYINSVSGDYGATVDNFDALAPEQKINKYVEDNTSGIIKDLLSPGSVDSDTLAVLVNTIFFNGTWDHQFSTFMTHKADFQKADGSLKQVDMMKMMKPITVDIAHDNARRLDMIDLPFKGRRFALRLVMPRDPTAMQQLEADRANLVDVSSFSNTFKNTAGVEVSIPKFKIETEQQLNAPLKALGIQKAFTHGVADFSGMSATPAHIDQVVHKAVIDVQESGTVAAAATGVVIVAESVMLTMDSFVADRPFLFFLRDQLTGTVLFQGKFSG